MTDVTGLLLGTPADAEHDGQAVAVGAIHEPRNLTAGAHGLVIDGILRNLRRPLRARSRHVGCDLRAPDAPDLAWIVLVAALEPLVEHADRDVSSVGQPPLHHADDQRMHRAEFVLRKSVHLLFELGVFEPGHEDDDADRKPEDTKAGDQHKAGLQP